MKKNYVITLGDASFTLGKFTIDQVSRLSVLLKELGPEVSLPETQPKSNARNTAIYIGLQTAGFGGKFEDFLQLPDVTVGSLGAAVLAVGRAIGYYSDPDAAKDGDQGEVQGAAASP